MKRPEASAQLVRQWRLLRLLCCRVYTARELAAKLGTTKTTVQRDLKTIREVFPLQERALGTQRRGYWMPSNRVFVLPMKPAETEHEHD